MITAEEARAALDSNDERLRVIEQQKKSFEKSVRRALGKGESMTYGNWQSVKLDSKYENTPYDIGEEMASWVVGLGYRVKKHHTRGTDGGVHYTVHW
tara:strand:+ start:7633 stop:7923 length:291 start_codon:yes stop_codon:yes gene_type:complete